MTNIEEIKPEDKFIRYDVLFQMAILKLCLTEDSFCTRMVGYFGGNDKESAKDLEKFTFFDLNSLHIIFKLIVSSYKEYGARPTHAQIAQIISFQEDKIKLDKSDRNERTFVDKADVQKALDKIMEVDVSNSLYYKEQMQFFVRQIKNEVNIKKINDIKRKHPEHAIKLMQQHVDEMNKISFEEDEIFDFDKIEDIIEESGNSMSSSIPTGIPQLDAALHGGLPRESLVVVLAGTNVGKSMFCNSLGVQCLNTVLANGVNAGYKVLHVPLEGMRYETPLRYLSCYTKIEYNKIITDALTDAERETIATAKTELKERLMIHLGFLGFNTPVETLVAKLDDIYKTYKFDMLIIDYGQLLSSQATNEGHRFTMTFVFRALAAAARKFKAVVISPAQATRQGQESQNQKNQFGPKNDNQKLPVLRSEDISEAFEIARVAGVIMSLNMTDDERNERKLRVFLEKQRHGEKGHTYGCLTDYARCNLITKNFYDSKSNVSRIIASDDSGSDENVFDLAMATGRSGKPEDTQLIDKLGLLALNIENVRTSIVKKKEELDEEKELNPFELEDPNGAYVKMKIEYDKLDSQLTDDIEMFKDLFSKKYPNPKQENLLEAQAQQTKLSLKPRKSDEEELLALQKFIRIYKLGLELINGK